MRKCVAHTFRDAYTPPMMKSLLPLAVIALPLGACAARDYPSLLPRAAEQRDFSEPPAPAPSPVVADPALDARITTARAALAEATAAFDNAATHAERLAAAAAGAPAGSDRWLDAQAALAELDAVRARQVDIVTDLEQWASQRALALAPAYPALDEAAAAAQQAADASTARIAAIQQRLAPAGPGRDNATPAPHDDPARR